jgi:proline dehydrogenase
MDNVTEIVALLRRQADLEIAIMNGQRSAVATEQELEATRQRLFAHPQALNAVLQTARALRRAPDTVSVRDVTDFAGSN